MAESSFSGRMVLKSKEQGVGRIVEPHLDSDILEQISIARDELDLPVSKLKFLVIRTINQRIKLNPVLQHHKVPILNSLNAYPTHLHDVTSLQLLILVGLQNFLG